MVIMWSSIFLRVKKIVIYMKNDDFTKKNGWMGGWTDRQRERGSLKERKLGKYLTFLHLLQQNGQWAKDVNECLRTCIQNLHVNIYITHVHTYTYTYLLKETGARGVKQPLLKVILQVIVISMTFRSPGSLSSGPSLSLTICGLSMKNSIVLKRVWTLKPRCKDWDPNSSPYYLGNLRQVCSFLCASVSPSVK